jgi:hypothetical protein
MIDPPQGSFSWVPAKHVERDGDTGTITEDNSVAFVGSEFGDEAGVWQRPLRAGERVRILGEREIDTHSGLQRMYQIEPPSREFRWIPGTAVVPVDAEVREKIDSDPYALPSQARRPPVQTDPATANAGVVDAPKIIPSRQLVRLQTIRAEQKELAAIDGRFREMLRQDPSQWQLEALESDYRNLQERVTYRPVAGQIDLRYPAIERYRKRQAEYDDFKRLTSQTEQRDAQLLAAQQSPYLTMAQGSLPGADTVIASPGPESMMSAGIPPNLAQLFAGLDATGGPMPDASAIADSTLPVPMAGDAPAQSAPFDAQSMRNRYVGAGIIVRAEEADGEAPYRLTSPTGKVLAHVKPDEGVDVESFVGKSVGLHGSRWFEDKVKSDYISVSGLEPVQLR